MRRARLAVLISGSGSNLGAILAACSTGELVADVALVVSNRADAFGLQRACDAGVPTAYHPLKPYREQGRSRLDYDADLAELVAQANVDWVILAGWMHVLSDAFLSRFLGRVVNLHPALPGAFPGARAIEDALAAYRRGEVDRTGVMVHLVPDERVDEGPVLATAEVPFLPGDTIGSVSKRIHVVEHQILVQTLAQLVLEAPDERRPVRSL